MIIYLAGTMQSSWTLIDFYWKRDYYTQNYCINLDAGITQCRASCFLENKMAMEREESSNSEIAVSKTSKSVECPSKELQTLFLGLKDISIEMEYPEDLYKFEFAHQVFHPPKG